MKKTLKRYSFLTQIEFYKGMYIDEHFSGDEYIYSFEEEEDFKAEIIAREDKIYFNGVDWSFYKWSWETEGYAKIPFLSETPKWFQDAYGETLDAQIRYGKMKRMLKK